MKTKMFRLFLILGFCTSVQSVTKCEPHVNIIKQVQYHLKSATDWLKISYSSETEHAYGVFNAILQKIQEIHSEHQSYNTEMSSYTKTKIQQGADSEQSDVEKLKREFKKFDDEHNITTQKLDEQHKKYESLNSEVDELHRKVQQLKEINTALEGKCQQLNKTHIEAESSNRNLTIIANKKLQA